MKEMRQVWMTEDGWVAERVDKCTCGGPFGDHHEPACGWEPIGKLNDAAPLRAAIEAQCEELAVEGSQFVANNQSAGHSDTRHRGRGDGMQSAARRVRALFADDGAAALREHDRQILEAAERRMFGTEDGDLIGEDSEIPAGELRRLLWEPFDTADRGDDALREVKADTWDECRRKVIEILGRMADEGERYGATTGEASGLTQSTRRLEHELKANPYRDTAGEGT